jgi:surface antigen
MRIRRALLLLLMATIATGAPAVGPVAPAAQAAALPYLDIFPRGQCVRWAYTKRPDIVNRGIRKFAIRDWNARRWADNARKAGFPVDRKARRGDVAVWQPGVLGAGSLGHVAFVEKVLGNGGIRVSEVNFNGTRTPTKRTIRARDVGRAEFIHRR